MKEYVGIFKPSLDAPAQSAKIEARDQQSAMEGFSKLAQERYGSEVIILTVVTAADHRISMETLDQFNAAFNGFRELIASQDADPLAISEIGDLTLFTKTALAKAIEHSHPRDVAAVIFRLSYLAGRE